jgi:ubiquinone/menaquinone biosynthesis C-methylase UbiE
MTTTGRRTEALLGDFAHVDHADSIDLVGRLDTMHALEFFRAYKQETFALMRLSSGAKAGDIGCGTGDDAHRMAEIVGASGRIVGFDVSEAMLGAARQRHGNVTNLSFVRSAADAIDTPANSLDAVRADRVLTHLADPCAALREMVRIVRPGGRIVVSEPDMPGCWVTNRYNEISARIMRVIAASCVNPYVARDLYHHFQDSGLEDVGLMLRSLVLTDPEPVQNILKFDVAMRAMIANGEMTSEEADRWLADFVQRRDRHRFLAGVTIFIVSGTKPETVSK